MAAQCLREIKSNTSEKSFRNLLGLSASAASTPVFTVIKTQYLPCRYADFFLDKLEWVGEIWGVQGFQ